MTTRKQPLSAVFTVAEVREQDGTGSALIIRLRAAQTPTAGPFWDAEANGEIVLQHVGKKAAVRFVPGTEMTITFTPSSEQKEA